MRDKKCLNKLQDLLYVWVENSSYSKINLYIYEISIKISTRFFWEQNKLADTKFGMKNLKIKIVRDRSYQILKYNIKSQLLKQCNTTS